MIGIALMVWEELVTTSGVTAEVIAVQRGDRDAFGSLLSRYQNRLYRYHLRWVRDAATAEDLFQQTWLRVLQNIRRFDPQKNFDAWLFAIARNLAIDHLRRYRPDSLDEPRGDDLPLAESFPGDGPVALERLLCAERTALVQLALSMQAPIHREILSLRFEEEMKLEAIAEVLAIPLSTVKSRLGRALLRLRATVTRLRPQEIPT